ncbi:MAG: AmmeMemoRadiSam system protein B [Geobacteraceae bacterium]|nr:AmmeMemoRadiSam system protein B [Geobacteraceae bacterium]
MMRKPAVAGQFYSADRSHLLSEVSSLIVERNQKTKAFGLLAPHAGYVYSGAVAGAVFGAVVIPDTVVIMGPNHHGLGGPASLFPVGEWLTPLGSVPVESGLSKMILENSRIISSDSSAHRFEHSIEVQIPFLQFLRPEVKIVPICLSLMDYDSCRALGTALAKSIKEFGKDVLMVASTDMTHYEPDAVAKKMDSMALKEVLELNPEGLYSVVRSKGISMCGIIPSTVMLVAALALGAASCELVRYATSGDVSGDKRQVVGYAGVMVS